MSEKKDVSAALDALDRFMAAFNAQSDDGVREAFNFPHIRFASGNVAIHQTPADFSLAGFRNRVAGDQWHHSAWDYRNVVQSGPNKVHFDVQFTRYREDGSVIGAYKSLWIVTCVEGHWGVQARSSYAQ